MIEKSKIYKAYGEYLKDIAMEYGPIGDKTHDGEHSFPKSHFKNEEYPEWFSDTDKIYPDQAKYPESDEEVFEAIEKQAEAVFESLKPEIKQKYLP